MDYTLPSEEETKAVLESPVDDGLETLSEEDKAVALKLINSPWYQKLLSRVEAKSEAAMAKKLDEFTTGLVASNKEMMKKQLDDIRKANEPLSPAELEKLVNQEYLEFNLKLPTRRDRAERAFIIQELPVKVERKLITVLKKSIGPMIKDLSGLDWTTEMGNLERLQSILDMVPGALETLAECAAICLNPNNEETDITQDWVLNNLPVAKMLAVLQLQMEANRWRDFFSLVYRAMPSQMMG